MARFGSGSGFGLLLLPVSLGFLSFCWASAGWSLDTFEEVRERSIQSEGILYDRNHEVLHEIRVNPRVRRLSWTPLDAISQVLKESVVYSEDRRFWKHRGVDWRAMTAVAIQNCISDHGRGASTITMQLASILSPDLQKKKGRRSWIQKLKQIRLAMDLERTWRKDQILEAYLNLISFRGELQGISAAAQGLFGKAPHGIDLSEALVLAVLIRSPQAEIRQVEKRACKLGMVFSFPCEFLQSALSQATLRTHSIQPQWAWAPHVAQRLLSWVSSEKVKAEKAKTEKAKAESTLDRRIQIFATEALQRQILSVRSKNVNDGTILVVDNRSGDVLAYVGSAGDLSTARYVDGVRALRQAGSTLKPFLYGLALDRRYLTPASVLEDSPLDVPVEGGVYQPRNYDHLFHGDQVSLRTALASSLNIPAVRTLNLVGVDPFVRMLSSLGFEMRKDPDYYGPSLALGALDVRLWDLVNAYRTLANQGVWSELRLDLSQPRSQTKRRVYSAEAAFLIADILSDRESRNLTFGLENPMASSFWSAAKTGTSKDMRDNWCLGFSERYTVGVWVGNFSGEPMWNVTGITGAAPVWSEIMKFLHRSLPSRSPVAPEPKAGARGVVQVDREWFIRGTQPSTVSREALAKQSQQSPQSSQAPRNPWKARISYPVEGLVIAMDPDIPAERQRIFFESKPHSSGLKWLLNGVEVQGAWLESGWAPGDAGEYTLALVDSKPGKVLDTIHFQVRGRKR